MAITIIIHCAVCNELIDAFVRENEIIGDEHVNHKPCPNCTEADLDNYVNSLSKPQVVTPDQGFPEHILNGD